MSIGTAIRSAMAPVVTKLVRETGSTVIVRRAVITRAPDNSEIRTWQTIASGDGVGCLITEVTVEAAAKEWGADKVITANGVCSDSVLVQENDGVVVSVGDYAGTQFRVQRTRPSPLGGVMKVALVTTQESFT